MKSIKLLLTISLILTAFAKKDEIAEGIIK